MSAAAPRLRFSKMHGAGNDFVLLDRRAADAPLSPQLAARLADRHRGVGCDQLLTIEPPRSPAARLSYRVWNADGSEARQCGNGARCVAAWARRAGLADESGVLMDSPAGTVAARFVDDAVEIELGAPATDPAAAGFHDGGASGGELEHRGTRLHFDVVSLGNPHAVIEVDRLADCDVAGIGAALQRDPRFADSCNVGFAERVSNRHLRLRVFERGVGETLACGSGACAAVAVMLRRGRVGHDVDVDLPGGRLQIHWPGGDAAMRMRGPAEFVFEGEFEP